MPATVPASAESGRTSMRLRRMVKARKTRMDASAVEPAKIRPWLRPSFSASERLASRRMAATGWEKESFTGSSTRTTRSSPSPTTSDTAWAGNG